MDITQYNIYTKLLRESLDKLSQCTCLQDCSLYEEVESFLSIQNNLIDKGANAALDKLAPAERYYAEAQQVVANIPLAESERSYDFFLSVGFPQKDKVFTKYEDKKTYVPRDIGPLRKGIKCTPKDKYILGNIEYRALSTDEQYRFILRGLHRVKDLLTPQGGNYHYFIEKCQSGDLHFHGRFESQMNMKDIKLMFHNAFGISMDRLKTFCNIKKYDALKWRSYHEKEATKQYQTTSYPHIKNI